MDGTVIVVFAEMCMFYLQFVVTILSTQTVLYLMRVGSVFCEFHWAGQ